MANRTDSVASMAVARNPGWIVTFAGTGVNLALGVLYSWSVVSQAIPEAWGWTQAEKSLPYSIACIVFAFVMILAGRLQDQIGPRLVTTVGGVLVGVGMVLCSLTTTPAGYVIGFGILAGAGIGFGYASATPPAVKWFSKAKTGLIAGLVVSGFGLASVYVAPCTQWLAANLGLPTTMLVLGIGFFVVVTGLAQLLKTPPPGYSPPEDTVPSIQVSSTQMSVIEKAEVKEEYSSPEMLRTGQFYLLWLMYTFGAGAGLMIISKLSKIATDQAGVSLGFLFVAILAIGNGAGRILAGLISDKVGRTRTMLYCFTLQAILMVLLSQATVGSVLAIPVVLGICSALIGANYGANLSLFPSVTKDWFGLKNFGMNYGLVFTAWGVGGFVFPLIAGVLYDSFQSFNYAYFLSAGLLVVAAGLTFVTHQPGREEEQGQVNPTGEAIPWRPRSS